MKIDQFADGKWGAIVIRKTKPYYFKGRNGL
jgi:hypothetical protein